MCLFSFSPHLPPIGENPSVAPKTDSLASVCVVKSTFGKSLQALGVIFYHRCNSGLA